MDPLSVIAGIIGIAATTAHTTRRLKEFLDSIKETPETVRSIARELGILQCSLTALEELLHSGDDFSEVAQTDEGVRCILSLRTVLTHCQHTLESVHQIVRPFTEKRNGSREYKWKAMAGWISRKDTLDSLKRELVNAKMTLDLGVTLATFLLTRAGFSLLQTQFTQLNTRLEQEASEDNMSDIGSSSVVTDLGFTLRQFLREPDTVAVSSNPFITGDEKRPATDVINDDFGWRSGRRANANGFANNSKDDSRPKTGHSFDLKEAYLDSSSPPDSPLSKRTTFGSLEPYSPITPVTSFTTSFRSTEQYRKQPDAEYKTTNPSQAQQNLLTNHDSLPKHLPVEPVSSGLYHDDTGWQDFQIPLRAFSSYFALTFDKMMKKSPTSMLNFGIVTAKPIANTTAYLDNPADSGGEKLGHSWDQMKESKLYRRSAPDWTLKIPGHKVSGKPPTRGVSRVSLSKIVTNELSYEFVRLFIVAQKPQNTTAYNFQQKPFCAFTYIGHPRKVRDIGVDDESTSNGIKIIADATAVSVWLAVKDQVLTFRLKSADDKYFLSPRHAYWSVDPELVVS